MNSRKLLTTGIAGVIALVPAALALYLGAFDDNSPAQPARAVEKSHVLFVAPTAAVPSPGRRRPSRPVPTLVDKPARGPSFAIARPRGGSRVTMWRSPGGRIVGVVGRQTEFGSPVALSVVKRRGGWLGVAMPDLPNGRLGWIRRDPNRVRLYWTKYALQVDLSTRTMSVGYGKATVDRFVVTVGGPGSETPAGRFAITDALRFDGSPFYGCCALALSGHQTRLPPGWLGGDRIAIHGTPGPVGEAESHGCLRATDATMRLLLKRVPLGAPVFIRR